MHTSIGRLTYIINRTLDAYAMLINQSRSTAIHLLTPFFCVSAQLLNPYSFPSFMPFF